MTELRISATLELPDDIWANARMLVEAEPIIEAFTAALELLGGKVHFHTVAQRPDQMAGWRASLAGGVMT